MDKICSLTLLLDNPPKWGLLEIRREGSSSVTVSTKSFRPSYCNGVLLPKTFDLGSGMYFQLTENEDRTWTASFWSVNDGSASHHSWPLNKGSLINTRHELLLRGKWGSDDTTWVYAEDDSRNKEPQEKPQPTELNAVLEKLLKALPVEGASHVMIDVAELLLDEELLGDFAKHSKIQDLRAKVCDEISLYMTRNNLNEQESKKLPRLAMRLALAVQKTR